MHAVSYILIRMRTSTCEQVAAGALLSAIVHCIYNLRNDLADRLLFVIWLQLWTRQKLLPFIFAGIFFVHATNGNGNATEASFLLSFVDEYCTCALPWRHFSIPFSRPSPQKKLEKCCSYHDYCALTPSGCGLRSEYRQARREPHVQEKAE